MSYTACKVITDTYGDDYHYYYYSLYLVFLLLQHRHFPHCRTLAGFLLKSFLLDNINSPYMSEKAAGHHGSIPLTGLQLWQEVVTVEIIELLQVAEDDASLAPQVLRDVWSVQQGEVVGQDVAQGADILSFCVHQLLQDTLQPPGGHRQQMLLSFVYILRESTDFLMRYTLSP